ncbi:conserved exported hypothetical protein [Candidatus Sulfopaludibacter sp. SbA3]|nr:conserved exported hypothetical protein [Candidatus Sulfopaludibacter sp. SbA3]
MKTRALAAALSACLAFGAYAQTEAVPEFEVVSVKPAPPPTGNGIRVMMNGGPGSEDPGRLDWTNVSLQNIVTTAFNIKDYQLQGQEWMKSERFDVTAKIPPNTSKEQYRLMLQKLLADRFKMAFHHDTREHAVYALTVGKGGPKLQESDPNDTSGFAPMMMPGSDGGRVRAGTPLNGPPPPPPPPPGGAGRGTGGGSGRGGMMMMRPGHLQAKRIGVEGLANLLSNITGKPVIDQTELKGIYDFTLDYAPDTAEGGPMMMGGMPPPPPGAGGGEGGRMPMASEPTGMTIYAAVQQTLGLKLEAKKLPLDNVVIDRIERVPTEN